MGLGKRIALGDGSMVLSGLVDELNIAGNYCVINARPFLGGRAGYRTAYVDSPMVIDLLKRGSWLVQRP